MYAYCMYLTVVTACISGFSAGGLLNQSTKQHKLRPAPQVVTVDTRYVVAILRTVIKWWSLLLKHFLCIIYHIITSRQFIWSESPELCTLWFYWPSWAHYTVVQYVLLSFLTIMILVAVLNHTVFTSSRMVLETSLVQAAPTCMRDHILKSVIMMS